MSLARGGCIVRVAATTVIFYSHQPRDGHHVADGYRKYCWFSGFVCGLFLVNGQRLPF
jgi:hypothetical protein